MSYNFSSQPWKPSHYNVHPWRLDISSLHQRTSRPSRAHCADQGSNSQFCPKFMMICLLSWRKARMPSIGLCNSSYVLWKPSKNTNKTSFKSSEGLCCKFSVKLENSHHDLDIKCDHVITVESVVHFFVTKWSCSSSVGLLGNLPKTKTRPTQPIKSQTTKSESAALPHESFDQLNMTWMLTWDWNVAWGIIAVSWSEICRWKITRCAA